MYRGTHSLHSFTTFTIFNKLAREYLDKILARYNTCFDIALARFNTRNWQITVGDCRGFSIFQIGDFQYFKYLKLSGILEIVGDFQYFKYLKLSGICIICCIETFWKSRLYWNFLKIPGIFNISTWKHFNRHLHHLLHWNLIDDTWDFQKIFGIFKKFLKLTILGIFKKFLGFSEIDDTWDFQKNFGIFKISILVLLVLWQQMM